MSFNTHHEASAMGKADTSCAGINRMAIYKKLPTECVHVCVSGVGVRHK